MQLEIEQKYPVDDLRRIRKSLEALGATFEPPIRQVDLYFRHPARDFAQTDEALRLRQVGEENCITYKGPKIDAETKTRREIELPLEPGQKNFDSWEEMLDILGFRRVRDVAKERIPGIVTWEGGEVHLALDQVAGLGTFLELEILADERELDSAKSRLASLAKKLGLDRFERRGYLDLLLSKPVT
ncbi:MAG: class IV adenylate cyclase [Planctomycetales bacterium]|nr:class IV adenylate cyclase [Planctomycetales bacterium]